MALTSKVKRNGLLAACPWMLAVACLHAQANHSSDRGNASPEGRTTFAASCANCHGLDGRGAERGPDIATRKEIQRLTDAALLHIVGEGVPGTGMPPFRAFGKTRIESVVAYLRILQGKGADARMPGDPVEGKTLFFGKAECSHCHVVSGAGGFIGTDLSNYAVTRSVEEIRHAIVAVSVAANRANTLVVVTLRDGKKLRGIARNEDNFSLQLQTLDGTFYSLSKAECQIESPGQPIMPADYGSRLTPRELDHLVSYLMQASRNAKLPGDARQPEHED